MSSRSSRAVAADSSDHSRLLGALLRLSHQALIAELSAGLERAGFTDIPPSLNPAMHALWNAPQGTRATELASAALITKQSMGALIDQLEERGYVERIDDPSDKRAKLVRLTKRGREAGRIMRANVRRIESDWAERVGHERLEALKQTLRELLASLEG